MTTTPPRAIRTRTDRVPRRTLAALVVASTLAAGCGDEALGRGGSSGPRRDAPADASIVFGQLPAFSLVDASGATVERDDLLGRPFALACIFTTCAGPCPKISREMQTLQEELADVDVGLVSLSVDPKRDTPEVLAAYAARFEADPERWTFLTGDEAEIEELVRGSFYLALARQEPSEDVPLGIHVTHSTEMVVFDADGGIRGYYSATERRGLEALEARLRYLASEDR